MKERILMGNQLDPLLIQALQKRYQSPSLKTQKKLRQSLWQMIAEENETARHSALLNALRKAYTTAGNTIRQRVWNSILTSIEEKRETWSLWTSSPLKAAFSSALAISLIFSIPFFQQTQPVTAAENFYVTGKFALNGVSHQPGAIVPLSAGSVITTGISGFASVILPGRARLELSNKSHIKLSNVLPDEALELTLKNGKIWSQSLSIPVRIEGDEREYQAVVLKGSSNIETDERNTKISGTNITDVFVHQNNQVTLSQKLFPGDLLTISERSKKARKGRITQVSPQEFNWITTNLKKDQLFYMNAETNTLTQERANAGALPGDPFYRLEQIAQRIQEAMALDVRRKLRQKLEIAGRELSKSIVLLEKGNESAAVQHLNTYASELYSTLALASDTIGDERNTLNHEILEFLDTKKKQLEALERTSPLILPKRRTKELSFRIYAELKTPETSVLFLEGKARELLTEAHKAAIEQRAELALEKLEDFVTLREISKNKVKHLTSAEFLSGMLQAKSLNLNILNQLKTFEPLHKLAENLLQTEAQSIEHYSQMLNNESENLSNSSIRGRAL